MKKKYDHDKIFELYKAGYTNKEISKMIGCRPCTVTETINRMEERSISERRNDRLKYLHGKVIELGDTSISDAALRLNSTRYMLLRCFRKFGRPANCRLDSGASSFKVLSLLVQGLSHVKISKLLGISKQRVSAIAMSAKKEGLEYEPRRKNYITSRFGTDKQQFRTEQSLDTGTSMVELIQDEHPCQSHPDRGVCHGHGGEGLGTETIIVGPL